MKKDFVSIIVPTLNASRTINSTLNSIVKQSFKKWEVIIIDGHSTDNTISIVKKFQNNKFKVYFLSKKKDQLKQDIWVLKNHVVITLLFQMQMTYGKKINSNFN